MSEQKTVTLLGQRAGRLLAGMADIAQDLWGESPAAPAPAARPRPAFPPFEQLWKVADETVDWTDALSRATPADGLTDPQDWALYRRYAPQVLRGDTDAYLAVIEAMQPLDDLSDYAGPFQIAAPSSEVLEASFQAARSYLDKSPEEARRYLAGMAVRVARDLFALLPVTRVDVAARSGEKTLLTVDFDKAEMLKVRFAFIDPVAFTLQCGGAFAEED